MNICFSLVFLILCSPGLRPMTASQSLVLTRTAYKEGLSAFVPGQTYFGKSDYIEYLAGDLPIVISVPHGGHLEPAEIPDREIRTGGHYDTNTQELAREIIDVFRHKTGHVPHVIINRLHRNKLDTNREMADGAGDDSTAMKAWEEFHEFIDGAAREVARAHRKGLYIDLHGHRHDQQCVELGYLLVAGQLAMRDQQLDSAVQFSETSIGLLLQEKEVSLSASIRGDGSFGAFLEKQGYASVPSNRRPAPTGKQYFSGGYNLERHSSFSGGLLCGIQVETPMNVRESAEQQKKFAEAFEVAIMEFLKLHKFIYL